MAPTPKGKQGTKGSKQIVEENVSTLKFYRNMCLGACGIYFLVMFLLTDSFGGGTITLSIMSVAAHVACYQFMAMMCRPKISETGSILDSGSDLNMEGGIAEHVKDLIILTSGTQILSLISNYFWYALLLAPIRAIYMLWGSVIQPWLGSRKKEGEEKPELDEKKQKKLDRKMRRMR